MILMYEKTSNPPILHYVPLSRCKKGESPFVEFPKGFKVGDIEVLKESFTTPLPKYLKIETPEEDAEDVPQSLEDGGQSIVDELKEVNLGIIEEPHPTIINASLISENEGKYISLLTEYRDIFAWSYKEMPGLDPFMIHPFMKKHEQ
ncbi:uncharacterized protein E5676_scaffold892G00520 [Cucumis melo var. makuwa]|uniref:RNA-directed DNA polymerase-like protein n=1 Tax=Cucumis melo var. makuwa TaxID=1194695 RepID=A0A5D3CWG9_CUCMM|nr:uncharacterized protein E6C27_scaffold64G003430 [Cucumis melo var. makuwa]TYK15274.1 uncharacterized protein E5676_scaffold892G00520 [Cucumis melo var. makuwa]